MSDLSDMKCIVCGDALERVRYYPRQLLTADDMRVEQEYFRSKLRRHNRFLHGWGVVCGCEVKPLADAKRWKVRVCPGYAVGPQGDEIQIDDCVDVDLMLGVDPNACSVPCPCPPTGEMPGDRQRGSVVYIAVRYAECLTRPARVHPAGCGCDEPLCEYSRVRESFEIKVLWELPECHRLAAKADAAWCAQLQAGSTNDNIRLQTYPVPPCPVCCSDAWVVLATVAFMAHETPSVNAAGLPNMQISTKDRRVLLSTQHLQAATLCLP